MEDMKAFLERYRPKRFEDFVGQNEAVSFLAKAAAHGRAENIVLLGPPGSGKTSLAAVYARRFHCTNAKANSPSPCLTCEECVSFKLITNDMSAATLKELGSVTGRDIFSSSDYRFTFLDEAQLNKSSFDYLLGNLENALSYNRFIFATTQPSAIPQTIVGRCATVRTKILSRSDSIVLLERIAASESFSLDSEKLHLIADSRSGDARQLAKAIWEIKTYSLQTVDQLRSFFTPPDFVLGVSYFELAINGGKTKDQIALLRAWRQSPAEKQELVYELIHHLYSTEWLRLRGGSSGFNLSAAKSKSFAKIVSNLAKRANQTENRFWLDLMTFWEVRKPVSPASLEHRAARFADQMHQLWETATPADRRSKGRKQICVRQIKPPTVCSAGHYLEYAQVKAIWTAASFLIQRFGVTLNVRITVRWRRMGISSEADAAESTSRMLHKLGMAVHRWQPNCRWCYILAYECTAAVGPTTIILAHIPHRLCDRAAEFVRNAVGSGPSCIRAVKTGWVKSQTRHILAYVHRRNLRFLSAGVDPSVVVRDKAYEHLAVRDALKIPKRFRRCVGPWPAAQRYRVSHLIGDSAQLAIAESDMPFLDLMADGAWSYIDTDWEFKEYGDRLAERRDRQRLSLAPVERGIVLDMSPDALTQVKLRKRSWKGWWTS